MLHFKKIKNYMWSRPLSAGNKFSVNVSKYVSHHEHYKSSIEAEGEIVIGILHNIWGYSYLGQLLWLRNQSLGQRDRHPANQC